VIEKAADPFDEIQSAGERGARDLAICIVNRICSGVWRSALTRMAGETYGACLHCDAESASSAWLRFPDGVLHPVPGGADRTGVRDHGGVRWFAADAA